MTEEIVAMHKPSANGALKMEDHLRHYQDIREQCLLNSLKTLGLNKTVLEKLAQFLCKMSGLYDQAARAASSL
jgi:predicted MarR family transcription regulator